jgi:PilZ domain
MEGSKTEFTAARSNKRRHPRVTTNVRITIYLENGRGSRRSIEVRAIDASRTGILVQSDHPIPTGTVAFLQAATLMLSGKATVRYCRQQGLGYRIGMHLPDALVSRALLGERNQAAIPKA